MIRICFVCMGNICRSPLAEGIFKHLAAESGRGHNFHIESFGIGAWHVGEEPDPRSQAVARRHGLRLTSHAQQFRPNDFARFDHVLALDETIAENLQHLASDRASRAKIRLLRPYDSEANGHRDVPDPYYGDQKEFEAVYQMVDRACQALFHEVTATGATKHE